MAAKASTKKKTTRKPSASRANKNSGQKKAQPQWQFALLRLCLFLCMVALSVIALFRMGVVGGFLFELAALFIGWLAVPFYILLMTLCILLIIYRRQRLPKRYLAGFLCIFLCMSLFLAIREFRGLSASQTLSMAMEQSREVFSGTIPVSGLIGALLFAAFASLFDIPGAYIICVLFLVLGVVLIGYTWFLENRDRLKPDPKKVEARKQERTQKKQEKQVQKQARKAPRDMPAIPEAANAKNSPFKIIEADEVTEVSPGEVLSQEPARQKRSRKRSAIDIRADAPQDDPFSHSKFEQPPFEELKEPNIIEETDRALRKRTEKKKEPKEQPVVEDIHAAPSEYIKPENPYKDYQLPSLSLLDDGGKKVRSNTNKNAAAAQGAKLIEILEQFSVDASLKEVHIGPSVTKFEITLKPGVRVSKITSLSGDIKMALAATDIRIEAPIPGKSAVGIEIPNVEKTTVHMKEVLRQVPARLQKEPLLIALGKDLLGENVFGQLNRMPHLLIAGATGSGKSVCVNSIICSLLLRTKPDEVKLILIDPKKVEFTPYNNVPHLLAPVITDGTMANDALKVVVNMMDERYDLFGSVGVRNLEGYNELVSAHPEDGLPVLPRIVVIIDELADLMLVAAKEVEQSIQRITQLARAAGIHLIVATQRPSVDIITGVIKANIPSRIAFAVSQAVDSRTILDQSGAEKLLGYGDMLYLPNGETAPRRVQGVFIEDEEVVRITDYVKGQAQPSYDDAFIQLQQINSTTREVSAKSTDPLYDAVKSFVISTGRASTSLIQRKFSIGYGRAARLIDILEQEGIVGPANGSKPRKILVQNTSEDPDDLL